MSVSKTTISDPAVRREPEPDARFKEKEQSLLTGFFLGAASIVPDIIAVVQANSVMLLSDLLKTGSESLATFLSWLALRRVRQDRSFDYNYGQGKLENIASLAVAGALIFSWMIVVFGAVERFRRPAPLGDIRLALFVTGGSWLINLWIWRKSRRLAEASPSPIMESQWRLYRAKAIANLCVISTLLAGAAFRGQSWVVYLDPIGALLISGLLLFSAYRVATNSIYDLLDRTLDESMQLVIMSELAAEFHEYEALHGVRSRRSGGNVYIEIFMEFPPDRRMGEVQELIDRMKANLERKIQGSRVVIAPASGPVA